VGGKTSTSSATVDIPPQVLAQYNAVNAAATQTASNPFQTYGGEFVAPVNQTQAAGIANTTAAANEAQPYYGAATGVLGAAQAGVNPINQYAENATASSSQPLSGADINRYLSPYLNDVLQSTAGVLNQNNQQQQAGQLGDAIMSGAFGGDRTGIAAANLEEQQNLANAQIYSGIANQGYQSALTTAQGQQQVGLAGAQQLAGIGQTAYGEGANTASGLASLGSGAQGAALTGANAQIAAGTVEQQTAQAQDTAQYNQFLQEQSYPFQVDQFLANIAEGTGSLSGSATITQQPGGFFSDKRLKRDIQKIGKTFDGQDIVSYKMGSDERTHIGLIAQDVEKKHPQAVGVAGGFKTVDYGKATERAANQGHFCAGGVVPIRQRRDAGGGVYDLTDVLNAQRQMYGTAGGNQQRNINTGSSGGHSLPVANAPPAAPPQSGMSQVGQGMQLVNQGHKLYKSFNTPASTATTPSGVAGTELPEGEGIGDASASSMASAPLPTVDAGLGSSAAPAAADAAATGAASGAAAGAASGAAGAGSGALVAGGADAAAADAAAALAAEYAAADVGAAAVMAAKRGGKVRKGFDLGGSPYTAPGEDAQGNLDIPDQPNTNTLKAAPAAGKQPTGLQTMMYMGDPNNTSSLMGSMFSNQALATGGVAGGSSDEISEVPPTSKQDVRDGLKHYMLNGNRYRVSPDGRYVETKLEYGGNRPYSVWAPSSTAEGQRVRQHHLSKRSGLATGGIARIGYADGGDPMDPESDAPVEAPSTDTQPDASAPAPSAGTGVASGSASGPSWWDRNKGWVLPVVRGVGAMGTAKTVHPGVALAAGLEAGAEAYTPTQEGLAKAAQTTAVTQGDVLQNKLTQMKLDAIDRWTNQRDTSAASGVVGSAPAGSASSPVPSASGVAAQAPQPQAAPVPTLGGGTGAAPPASVQDPRAAAAQAAQTDRQRFYVPPILPNEAQAMHVARGAAWATGSNQPVDDQQFKIDARVTAARSANANTAQGEADQLYATATNPNVDQATRDRATALYASKFPWTGDKLDNVAGALRDSRTGQPPIGTLAQALTPEQLAAGWGIDHDENGVPWAVNRINQQRVPLSSMSSSPSSSATPATPATPAKPVSNGAAGGIDYLPGVNFSALPRTAATSGYATKTTQNLPEKTEEYRTAKLADASEAAEQDARTRSVVKAAQNELAKIPARAVGPGSDIYNGFQKLYTAVSGSAPDALVDEQALDKYLNQVGAQNVRSLLQGQKITNQEMMMFMSRGTPNIAQPIATLKNLVNYLDADTDYDRRLQNTKIQALTTGADPWKLSGVIENIPGASRAEYVQGRLGFSPGFTPKQRAGAAATGSAPPAAIAYLQQHPEAAPQFRAKYGYLP
jgi:hypothetical protein